jgi:hypothetical protein
LTPESEERPDFDIKLSDGRMLRFEVTEAIEHARKRGDEIRHWIAQGSPSVVSCDYTSDVSQVQQAISRVVAGKIEKAEKGLYPVDTNLLIYSNLLVFEDSVDELRSAILAGAAHGGKLFRSVWVLCDGRILRCSPNQLLSATVDFRPSPHVLGEAMRIHSRTRLERIFGARQGVQ